LRNPPTRLRLRRARQAHVITQLLPSIRSSTEPDNPAHSRQSLGSRPRDRRRRTSLYHPIVVIKRSIPIPLPLGQRTQVVQRTLALRIRQQATQKVVLGPRQVSARPQPL